MFEKSFLSLHLFLEQNKRVSSRPSIWLLDKQNSTLFIKNIAGFFPIIEEINLKMKDY